MTNEEGVCISLSHYFDVLAEHLQYSTYKYI